MTVKGEGSCEWPGCDVPGAVSHSVDEPWLWYCWDHIPGQETCLPELSRDVGPISSCVQCGVLSARWTADGEEPLHPYCRRLYAIRRAGGVMARGAYARRSLRS
jgi:hypothetical protein